MGGVYAPLPVLCRNEYALIYIYNCMVCLCYILVILVLLLTLKIKSVGLYSCRILGRTNDSTLTFNAGNMNLICFERDGSKSCQLRITESAHGLGCVFSYVYNSD